MLVKKAQKPRCPWIYRADMIPVARIRLWPTMMGRERRSFCLKKGIVNLNFNWRVTLEKKKRKRASDRGWLVLFLCGVGGYDGTCEVETEVKAEK